MAISDLGHTLRRVTAITADLGQILLQDFEAKVVLGRLYSTIGLLQTGIERFELLLPERHQSPQPDPQDLK